MLNLFNNLFCLVWKVKTSALLEIKIHLMFNSTFKSPLSGRSSAFIIHSFIHYKLWRNEENSVVGRSNGTLKAVWLGGVQINGLVHLVAEKNEMDPSLSIQMLHFSDESWRGCWCLHPPRGSLHRHGWLQPRVHVYWRIQSLRLPLLQNEEWTFLFSHQKQSFSRLYWLWQKYI